LALSLVLPLAAARAQGDPQVIEQVIQDGKNESRFMADITELIAVFGPRLTGSPQLDASLRWAANKFEEYGLQNVRLEQWGEVPVQFYRGERQYGRIVGGPELTFSTPAWSPGTDGLERGPVVRRPTNEEELAQVADQLPGAWVLMPDPAPMVGPARWNPNDLDNQIAEYGIAGRVWSSGGPFVHTNGNWRGVDPDNLPEDVRVVIPRVQFRMIENRLDNGLTTELEFNIENVFVDEPMPQYNLIAELPGTTKPDEYVVVCGHLDSWDGPGTHGAADNANGSIVALEAARLLAQAGARPDRTILFVLWSGEEQGLLGSRAFVRMHEDKMPSVTAVLNEDAGPNWHGYLYGTEDMQDVLSRAIEPMTDAFENRPMEFRLTERMWTGGGSDHAPFVWEGVPAPWRGKRGDHPYARIWHTHLDRLEEINEMNSIQMSVGTAVLAYNLASAENLLPRVPIVEEGLNDRPILGLLPEFELEPAEQE
jgi:hypothetical protein